MAADLKRHSRAQRGMDDFHARSAGNDVVFFVELFRRFKAAAHAGAALVGQAAVKAAPAELRPMVDIGRPAGGAAALHFDFIVIVVFLALLLPQLGAKRGFVARIAKHHPARTDVAVMAFAVVIEVGVDAFHSFVIAVAVVVPCKKPMADRHGIMQAVAAGAAAGGDAFGIGVGRFMA